MSQSVKDISDQIACGSLTGFADNIFVLTTFWRHLWSITKQTRGKMKYKAPTPNRPRVSGPQILISKMWEGVMQFLLGILSNLKRQTSLMDVFFTTKLLIIYTCDRFDCTWKKSYLQVLIYELRNGMKWRYHHCEKHFFILFPQFIYDFFHISFYNHIHPITGGC